MTKLGEFFRNCLKVMTLKEVIEGIDCLPVEEDTKKWRVVFAALFENAVDLKELVAVLKDRGDFSIEIDARVVASFIQEPSDIVAFWRETRKHWAATEVISAIENFCRDMSAAEMAALINKVFALPPTEA